MKQNFKTIDYDWLTRITGDPFVDAGGYTNEYIFRKIFKLNKYAKLRFINS